MADHQIIAREGRCPEMRAFASSDSPKVFLMADSAALSVAFHVTPRQASELAAALMLAVEELAAREVERVSA